jgi:hypothetical protein
MKNAFIPGIFNYCDRWCERCPLSHRCEVYAEEQKQMAGNEEVNSKAFWDQLSASIQSAMTMLRDMADEEGINLEEVALTPPAPLPAEKEQLAEKAKRYAISVMKWKKQQQPQWVSRREEYIQQLKLGMDIEQEVKQLYDDYEAVQWHCTIIAAKVLRALESQHNALYPEGLHDADGTAKVVLICVRKSIDAWHNILKLFPDWTDSIIDFLATLNQVQKGMLHYFPNAEAFVRPGFDECTV